jgi:hypothetical protein
MPKHWKSSPSPTKQPKEETVNWNYKGTEITATESGQFRAMFGKVAIIKPSLEAAKKAINKKLEEKAEATPVNLSLVVLWEKRSYREFGARKITHEVITGVDPETRRITGFPEMKDWRAREILPDSMDNTRRLEELMAARIVKDRCEKAISGRGVSLSQPYWGRNKVAPYGVIVQNLLDNYAKAKKAEGD